MRGGDGVAEHDGIVVEGVVGAIEQRDLLMSGELSHEIGEVGVGMKFCHIAICKLVPTVLGVKVIPFAEVGRGSQLLLPKVVMQCLVAHASRPQPVDKHAESVVGRCRLIGAFQYNLSHNGVLINCVIIDNTCGIDMF